MNKLYGFVGCLTGFFVYCNLNNRTAVFLAWLQQLEVGIGRLELDIDAEATLDLLPQQRPYGAQDETQDPPGECVVLLIWTFQMLRTTRSYLYAVLAMPVCKPAVTILRNIRLVHALWEILISELYFEMAACVLPQKVLQHDFGIEKHACSPYVNKTQANPPSYHGYLAVIRVVDVPLALVLTLSRMVSRSASSTRNFRCI